MRKSHAHDDTPPPPTKLAIPWAELLARTFHITATECPVCGATMTVVAVVKRQEQCRRYSAHQGLVDEDSRVRAPPEVAA